ncbi:MAG TPA: hypothetical protein DEP38_15265 [Cyanobacteria bacterium UBA9226]|nr:hypothetical protein [Cyanobacteria bacterium UBA9226]
MTTTKTKSPISTPVWWHPISEAKSLEKPCPSKGWEQFDSLEEFKCFNLIKRAIYGNRQVTLERQKKIVLQESPLLEWHVDFTLKINQRLILIEYKGDWVKYEVNAETLLNYQLALAIPRCDKFILVSKKGSLLSKDNWAKSCEIPMSVVESTIKRITKEVRQNG